MRVMKERNIDPVPDREFDALRLYGEPDLNEEAILKQKYPARAHARKVVDELRAGGADNIDKGFIYLPGEVTTQYENSDMGPKFRQRRYFFYMTGVDLPDCAVTYDIARQNLILWIPFVEPRQAMWYGSFPSPGKAASMFDVDDVRLHRDLCKYLESQCDSSTTIFALNRNQQPTMTDTSREHPRFDRSALQPAMDRARVIKDEYEIALIRRANAISSRAHLEIMKNLLKMRNEQEVEATFQALSIAQGAHSQAYDIIAGAGANAATLHYDANNEPLKGKDLIVVDAGCEFRCYASDITRTLPISGEFTPKSAAIYHIVKGMQEEAIHSVIPGQEFAYLHAMTAEIAVDGLMDMCILVGDRDEIISSRVVSAFFPHGLGHHVGLECHDVSGDERLLFASSSKRTERSKREMITPMELEDIIMGSYSGGHQVLRPGMIVTVEPGIYFNRDYIEGYFLCRPEFARFFDKEVLETFYSVGGVRIEDDILVTEDGFENLTTAPKGKDMLDVINGRGK